LARSQDYTCIWHHHLTLNERLAVTYFHMRKHTIIGATSFHFSVRDGKRWFQSAMAAKQNWITKESG
jgi:hypothetical protein